VLILVLGGARSGKSAVAEQIAERLPQPVIYLATLTTDAADADLERRIAAHRARRPAGWRTVDAESDLATQMETLPGTVLVDSLGPWVARHQPEPEVVDAFTAAAVARAGDTVVVSDEVGMSVHPTTALGLAFRDRLGCVNSQLGAIADRVVLVVAGRIVTTAPLDVDAIVAGGH
jgi:adenosylcobinamide kinase / adenosylcobinamide-phosphate guanylyltransferase